MTDSALKVAFAGTPAFAATALRAIIDADFEVPLVLTQPDRPSGRGMKLTASPVKQLALDHGIAVDQPARLRTAEQQQRLAESHADVLIVAAYGLLLPPAVLALPRHGCINIHASLLPRWRGAAPIHRAIEAGDAESGITIMQMDEGLDTGPMLLKRSLPISPDDTTASLHDRLAVLGGVMIVEALRRLAAGSLPATPQPAEGVTYADKVAKSEAAIDWRLDAEVIARKIRAFEPFPGATTHFDATPLKIWRAATTAGSGAPGAILAADRHGITVACGQDALQITVLQKPGSRRLQAEEFLRGFPLKEGDHFLQA